MNQMESPSQELQDCLVNEMQAKGPEKKSCSLFNKLANSFKNCVQPKPEGIHKSSMGEDKMSCGMSQVEISIQRLQDHLMLLISDPKCCSFLTQKLSFLLCQSDIFMPVGWKIIDRLEFQVATLLQRLAGWILVPLSGFPFSQFVFFHCQHWNEL
jgi:hypothetical protein